jgi:lipoic acid synthetase
MKYWSPEEFDELKYLAEKKGFGMVASGPLVRSSFHADEVFQALKLKTGTERNSTFSA